MRQPRHTDLLVPDPGELAAEADRLAFWAKPNTVINRRPAGVTRYCPQCAGNFGPDNPHAVAGTFYWDQEAVDKRAEAVAAFLDGKNIV